MRSGQGCRYPSCSVGQTSKLQHSEGTKLLLQEPGHYADNRSQDIVQTDWNTNAFIILMRFSWRVLSALCQHFTPLKPLRYCSKWRLRRKAKKCNNIWNHLLSVKIFVSFCFKDLHKSVEIQDLAVLCCCQSTVIKLCIISHETDSTESCFFNRIRSIEHFRLLNLA